MPVVDLTRFMYRMIIDFYGSYESFAKSNNVPKEREHWKLYGRYLRLIIGHIYKDDKLVGYMVLDKKNDSEYLDLDYHNITWNRKELLKAYKIKPIEDPCDYPFLYRHRLSDGSIESITLSREEAIEKFGRQDKGFFELLAKAGDDEAERKANIKNSLESFIDCNFYQSTLWIGRVTDTDKKDQWEIYSTVATHFVGNLEDCIEFCMYRACKRFCSVLMISHFEHYRNEWNDKNIDKFIENLLTSVK